MLVMHLLQMYLVMDVCGYFKTCTIAERFGPDHVTSGDEDRKVEEMESEEDDHKMGDTPTPIQTPVKSTE